MAIKKIKLPDNTTVDINDSRLPAVTTTDNGKVLSVSGGIWSANSKPSYTLDEVTDGSTRKLANYVTLAGTETITGTKKFSHADIGAAIEVKRNDANYASIIKFSNVTDGALGYLGFSGSADASGIRPIYYNGSTTYGVYHSGNFTPSNYVTIAGEETISGAKTFTGAIVGIKYDNPRIGFYTASGTLNGVYAFRSLGVPEIYHPTDGWKALYHSGNSNKSDVAWACSKLTASGSISCYNVLSYTRADWNYINMPANGSLWITIGSDNYKMSIQPNLITTYVSLSVQGNINATGTITPGSDSRIKDNQKNISPEAAFSVIEKLNPKTWVWNEKSNEKLNGKSAAGLVAQEVKEILPDTVTISENGDIKDFHSLNYNTIQGYEIAAIKGLIEEVKSLKAEIEELKKQIK